MEKAEKQKGEMIWPPPDEPKVEDPGLIVDYVEKNAKKGDPDDVLKAADYYGWNLGKLRSIAIGDVKGKFVDEVVQDVNPTVALECGAWFGYSAVRIARLMKPGSCFYSLEIDPICTKLTERFVGHAGLSDKVKVILGDAHEVIPQLKEKYGIEKIDLALLDNSCKNYKGNLIEMLDAGLIQKGSVVLADNVLYPVANDYREFVRSHKRFESTLFDTHLT
uniref:catechol O-methyltransferase-like n=1 Tax=Styela clava TaxID=7725 RepID=UPI001939F017|nr:catechol O-methyltransferase-like [Styela clava]